MLIKFLLCFIDNACVGNLRGVPSYEDEAVTLLRTKGRVWQEASIVLVCQNLVVLLRVAVLALELHAVEGARLEDNLQCLALKNHVSREVEARGILDPVERPRGR